MTKIHFEWIFGVYAKISIPGDKTINGETRHKTSW